MRDYGKLHSAFWTSPDVQRMSDDGKLLAIYLLTSSHSTAVGCYRLPEAYVADDLGWPLERVSKGLAELFDNGFATHDSGSKWVVIHQFLKWNPPENPNQVKAVQKSFISIPDSVGVKPALARALAHFCQNIDRRILKPFLNPSETLSKPETETEVEIEEVNPIPASAMPMRGASPKSSSSAPAFEQFWVAWPRKVAKQDAEKAWSKVKPDAELLQQILAAVERFSRSEDWLRDGGKFIPYPATWLSGRRWEDEMPGVIEYSPQERAVMMAYNARLPALDWSPAEEAPYLTTRAAAIRAFIVGRPAKAQYGDADGARYFDWLAENLPAKAGIGFDWAIRLETYTRAIEGNFAALAEVVA